MAQPFHRSPEPTVGIEYELALVDPATSDLTPRAAEIIDAVKNMDENVHVEKEFLENTVELVTGVHHTIPAAVAELSRGLDTVMTVAKEKNLKTWASGSHPFSDWKTQPVSHKTPYTEIIERTQFWGRQMLIWGVHVHVGISHEEKVWPIINALMTNYPHLLALSASSPGWNGLDTGYASNRTMLYQQLPTAGIPYGFNTWSQWSDYIAQQSRSGVINHTGAMHFDIRPSGKWGTIEIRVSDATSNLRELAAIAALTHCLVVYYDQLYTAGKPLPSLQPWHNRENKWRAARYGMDAEIIVSRKTDETFVGDDVLRWMNILEPIAQQLGCVDELATLTEIIDHGAGYQRQRAIYQQTGSWAQVVDATSQEMLTRKPLTLGY